MCGICGKLNFEKGAEVDPGVLAGMLGSLRHRGPDDEGVYFDGRIGLGHRRLSIIDLTTGHQPLSNEDGTVWIVFNGEIYNFTELRRLLVARGHVFKTSADTEVIVHLYEEFGPACVNRLRGMFSFAIWDVKRQTLLLARDRVGIKPLYYYLSERCLSFASEIKALLADPALNREIAPDMIDRFLTFFYLPGEETLFRGVRKLLPGHYLLARQGRVEVVKYWDLDFSQVNERMSAHAAERQLLELMDEVVGMHMIADVPIGVLLSGGVDSTSVLSFAAEKTERPVSSYTVGFTDSGIADERPYARLAAEAFGSSHHEITISARDFAEFMPEYVWHMEEPVCEPPAIALYYVSRLAKNHVKVLLSGEGGDEAFAGYSNYRNLLWVERAKRSGLNGAAADFLSAANAVVRSARVAKYLPLLRATFPDYYYSRTSNPFRLNANGLDKLYSRDYLESVDRSYSVEPLRRLQMQAKGLDPLNAMLYLDTKSWLPDDLLIKADKMTMANSIELRVPFLDHKLLEFAAQLPTSLKVRGLKTKYIARRALRKRIPKTILTRRKAGFPVPYGGWLAKELKEWVRDVLSDRRFVNRGYFAPSAVRDLLARSEFTAAQSKEVFSLLTLELWQRTFLDHAPGKVA